MPGGGSLSIRKRYMGIVLLSALIVAFESVAVEAAINIYDIGPFTVSCVPTAVGGLILWAASARSTTAFVRGMDRRGWGWIAVLCALVASGVLLWFDSVGRIGASKEAILGGGSSEILFIVLFSAMFLGERLRRLEAVGSILVVAGVFLVLVDAEGATLAVGVGEAEAIVSSLLMAASVVLTASLLRQHPLTPLSSIELLLSGGMLLVAGAATGLVGLPDPEELLILAGIGAFPALGLLTYNAGLPKIGASLTSVLFALFGIMTVGVQLAVLALSPGADIMLPENLAVAVTGGAVAFAGVCLLNMTDHGHG